ncbi:unnamed protein product, partial [Brassica rapa]
SNSTLFDDYGRSISLSSGRDSSASSNSSKIVTAQIGLDGLRMHDPSTSRTLRIYSLENITRCEKLDSSILAFWSKTPVDIDAKRIRLQSNSYTTNTLLDTVTAAVFQVPKLTCFISLHFHHAFRSLFQYFVQVPISGSETIECGVCQNPFLVSAH